MHEEPLPKVPGYTLLRRLGAGQSGEVWLAEQRSTGRQVAVKLYQRRGPDLALLRREVEHLALLASAREVVQLIDVGWEATPPYCVMEYLPRGSLEDLLSARGALPVAEALALARRLARALFHLHARGVFHCDLKPANVLLDESGRPLLCDLGQVRLAGESDPALGTFFYMAPEQVQPDSAPSARWDVYALGAILYRALTGELPQRTAEAQAALRSNRPVAARLLFYRDHLRAAPPPSKHPVLRRLRGVDGALRGLLDRCLAADPAQRLPDAGAVLLALDDRVAALARRPLVALAVLGPALVLAGAAGLTLRGGAAALEATSLALEQRALQRSHLAAQFAARGAGRKIERRFLRLQQVAAEPGLQAALRAAATDSAAQATLQARLQQLLQEDGAGEGEVASWLINDASGVQRARAPASDSTGRAWAYRDYFHGQGRDLAPQGTPTPPPLREPHLSMVYQSRSSGNFQVTFSVPVWDGAAPRGPLGVLGTSVALGGFGELPPDLARDVERVALLVDSRPDAQGRDGLVLQHPQLLALRAAKQPLPPLYIAGGPLRALRERLQQGAQPTWELVHDRAHVDPVGGAYSGRWLASLAPVKARGKETGWVVLVQERASEALAPIAALRQRLLREALVALGLVLLALGLLYTLGRRALARPARSLPLPGGPQGNTLRSLDSTRRSEEPGKAGTS